MVDSINLHRYVDAVDTTDVSFSINHFVVRVVQSVRGVCVCVFRKK